MSIRRIEELTKTLRDAIAALKWAQDYARHEAENSKCALECYENMANDAIRAMYAVREELNVALLPSELSQRELNIFKDGFLLGWRKLDQSPICPSQLSYPSQGELIALFNSIK